MPKNRLDTIPYSVLWDDPARAERLGRMTQCGPFQPCPARDSVVVTGQVGVISREKGSAAARDAPRDAGPEPHWGGAARSPSRKSSAAGVFFCVWFVFNAFPEGSRSKSAVPCFPYRDYGSAVSPERTARPTALPAPSVPYPSSQRPCPGDRGVCPALGVPVSREGVCQSERRKEMDLQAGKETGCHTARRVPTLGVLL